VMAALPNIGGALCSTPQSLADAHYWSAMHNAAKTQNPLKLAGVPQTTGPISAVSGPKFAILSGHLEEILLLNKFVFQLSIRALVAKIQRYKRPSPHPKTLIGSAVFALTAKARVSQYFTTGRPFSPSKLPIRMGDLDLPGLLSNTWFLGSTRNPESTIVTDRPTDRRIMNATTPSVTTGRIGLRSTAMRPKIIDPFAD